MKINIDVNHRVKLFLMKYFETFSMKGNVKFSTKAFCRFVAATTLSLITLTNLMAVAIITYSRIYFN